MGMRTVLANTEATLRTQALVLEFWADLTRNMLQVAPPKNRGAIESDNGNEPPRQKGDGAQSPVEEPANLAV
jgi:hypothetical protein